MLDSLYRIYSHDVSGVVTGLLLLLVGLAAFRLTSGPARAVGAILGLCGVLLTAGGASHLVRVANIDRVLPPPGRMVDIGGYRLHVLAEGPAGGTPVVWFAGGHAGGLMVHHLHRRVREEMRSILVDRPGSGWSDTGPFPRTTRTEVDEIMRALEAAGEQGPYLFAGHSFGGLLAANIAYHYPEQTAAVALLDATPLDVIFYGADSAGLASFVAMSRWQGFLNAFGFYRVPVPVTQAAERGARYVDSVEPLPAIMALATRGGQAFATASAFEELTAAGLRDRAFDIAVYDGMLGDTPLYLVAPLDDPTTRPYADSVLGPGPDADRFYSMLRAARERYLGASTRAHRVVTPAGTGHNFPDSHPDFVADTVRRIQGDLREARGEGRGAGAAWRGAYGGLPPLDTLTPAELGSAFDEALARYRERLRQIRDSGDAPGFDNTILALERAEEPLRQLEATLAVFTTTASSGAWSEVAGRQNAALSRQRDEAAQDAVLFARIAAIDTSALSADDRRLVQVYRERFEQKGAGLAPEAQARLREINAELAELRQVFAQHTSQEEQTRVVPVADVNRLAGLDAAEIALAKVAAERRDTPDAWVIALQRPRVWPVLRQVHDRTLREEVWRAWTSRGTNGDEFDNRATMTRILELRGEKARLFGFGNFASWQTSRRMIGTPEAAQDLLLSAWQAVLPETRRQIAAMEDIAGDALEGQGLKPWDFLYYQEVLRARDFDLDMQEVQDYLALDNVIEAMFWSAGELYGLKFRELDNVPVVHDSVRVFEVARDNDVLGVLYLDLFSREGKGPASWASQYRSYASFDATGDGAQLPVVALHSAVTASDEAMIHVPWERANVIFHEFGHTLQTLQNTAPYPSLGPLTLPWDFIEAPSLLHERWFMDQRLLRRFMTNAAGEPMPGELIDRLGASLRAERPITLTLNFIASALVDMHLHTLADGRTIDAVEEEARLVEELALPAAIDLAMYAAHAFHTFTEQYAAGLYTYLWSNVIAADAAAAFRDAPGGLWDPDVASAWQSLIETANRRPIDESWTVFRGRSPRSDYLFEAYGLARP